MEFATESEAIAYVKDIKVYLTRCKIKRGDDTKPIRLGYRGAVRGYYKAEHDSIVETEWGVKHKDNDKWIEPLYYPLLWNSERANEYLLGIRVNGKLISRPSINSNMSEYLSQPFDKSLTIVEYV